MYHLVDNLQTTAGDALVGYFVKLKDSEGSYASLFSDTNGTPIVGVSGLADAAKTDAQGMYDLYVDDGDYDIEFFDSNDSTQLVSRIVGVPLFSEGSVAADLASVIEGKGASLVGTLTGDTLQDALDGYATREAIKALTAAAGRRVYLTEAERCGTFVFLAGNYSTHIAADTQEGIYLKADDVAASAGAWVRQLPAFSTWEADWFGIPNDPASGGGGGSEVQCHDEMSAMVNLGNLVNPSRIMFGSKIYTFGEAIPEWAFQVELFGARGAQGTIINKRYVELSATQGIFAFSDDGFTIDKITFRATSGEGGSAISAILTGLDPARGRTYLIDVYVLVGEYCNHSLYVNGMTNTVADTLGYRGLFIRGGEYFGATVSSWHIEGAHHVLAEAVFVTVTPVIGSVALQASGSSTVYNDDWQIHGIISGTINLDHFGSGGNGGRSHFISPQIGAINVDANCLSTMWTGPHVSGVVNNLADDGFVFTWDGIVVDYDLNVTAGYIIFGNGKIFQWGTVTTVSGEALANVLPVAFTSSNIQYSAQPTTMPAANIVTTSTIAKTAAAPSTQFDIRAFNTNISTWANTTNATAFRYTANGQ